MLLYLEASCSSRIRQNQIRLVSKALVECYPAGKLKTRFNDQWAEERIPSLSRSRAHEICSQIGLPCIGMHLSRLPWANIHSLTAAAATYFPLHFRHLVTLPLARSFSTCYLLGARKC